MLVYRYLMQVTVVKTKRVHDGTSMRGDVTKGHPILATNKQQIPSAVYDDPAGSVVAFFHDRRFYCRWFRDVQLYILATKGGL